MSSLERDPRLRALFDEAHEQDLLLAPPFARTWSMAKAAMVARRQRHPLKVLAAVSLVIGGLAFFSHRQLRPFVEGRARSTAWPEFSEPDYSLEFLLEPSPFEPRPFEPEVGEEESGEEQALDGLAEDEEPPDPMSVEPTKGLLP